MTPEREQILKDIEQSVCEQFGVTGTALKSARRGGQLKDPRMFFVMLANAKEFHPKEIAEYLCKDRTLILHYLKWMGIPVMVKS